MPVHLVRTLIFSNYVSISLILPTEENILLGTSLDGHISKCALYLTEKHRQLDKFIRILSQNVGHEDRAGPKVGGWANFVAWKLKSDLHLIR